MRFLFVAVVFGLLLPSPADAQSPPTVPATITLTCYGTTEAQSVPTTASLFRIYSP